ncbi:Glyoxalase-like domain-containing protein [Desulfuromusa kysingii]|uniref:Glyoxalase-like domain-containing protein n=1 Tax=Desulfuromusa kysingii TaxID=37625 RepID=A0A1H4BI15_9BACT|nr:VOC family protein [Desulfuromusa kysingii]SEA47770.1 Glyoxalase-like domain-containing protein [Desulfuromusa kysingii]
MSTHIDHLVVGAESLSQGVDYVRSCMGVDIPYGGTHEKMGTHNHLMKIGKELFFEIIAINPDMDPPDRPRWFGLDDPAVRQQIAQQPRLLTWVVNTNNLKKLMQQTLLSFGNIEPITRGKLSWDFGLPDDGSLIAAGMLPYPIQWHSDKHPATEMVDLNCRFLSLKIYHPYPEWLQSALATIGAQKLVKIIPLPKNALPYMAASFNTPTGLKTLKSYSATAGGVCPTMR